MSPNYHLNQFACIGGALANFPAASTISAHSSSRNRWMREKGEADDNRSSSGGGTHGDSRDASSVSRGHDDSGFVTGNSQIKGDLGQTHAFIWERNAGMVDLGTLAGDFSYGTSINATNHVAGYSTIDKDNDRVHAFLHDGKQMLDLGSLGGAAFGNDRSFALGVNANDQVVGYSYLPIDRMQQVAFVYSNGLMVNLNDRLMTPAKDYRLDAAMAINDKGQIVAIAWLKAAEATEEIARDDLSRQFALAFSSVYTNHKKQ